jgi:hypothetical protein
MMVMKMLLFQRLTTTDNLIWGLNKSVGGIFGSQGDAPLEIITKSTLAVRISGDEIYFSDSLGIGFSSPTARLDVNGNIKITGKVLGFDSDLANLVPTCYDEVDHPTGGSFSYNGTSN